jgi:hypothetical protein
MKYVRDRQDANDVPVPDRVLLQQVARPSKATVFQPRSKTMPIVIFAAVMFAFVALALLLENVRPRSLAVSESGEPDGGPLAVQGVANRAVS